MNSFYSYISHYELAHKHFIENDKYLFAVNNHIIIIINLFLVPRAFKIKKEKKSWILDWSLVENIKNALCLFFRNFVCII